MEPTEGPRPPRQERSRRTLRNLERAALELVARDGAEAITVAAVVARARSSVGSFYARFAGKDDLFRHLEARLWDEALARWHASGIVAGDPGGPAAPRLEATVAFLVELEKTGGALRRSLGVGGSSSESEARFLDGLTGDLAVLLGRGGDPEGEGRVHLGLRIVQAVLSALSAGVDGRAGDGGTPLSPSAMEPDLTRILAAVLEVAPAGAEDGAISGVQEQNTTPEPDTSPEPVDPFDVWG